LARPFSIVVRGARPKWRYDKPVLPVLKHLALGQVIALGIVHSANTLEADVFFSDEARDAFQSDLKANIKDAQSKWPEVIKLTKVIR